MQHFAAMLEDLKVGMLVNLTSKNDDDTVNDLYQSLVYPINKAINKYGKNNIQDKALKYVKLNITILKTSIMTLVYNVSPNGIYN